MENNNMEQNQQKDNSTSGKLLKYSGVVYGKEVKEFDVFKPDGDVEQTQECIDWWKENYTKENGAFWYKTT